MSALVIDTHTLIWYKNKSSRLSKAADATLLAAEAGGELIYIPSIVIVELRYLIEKGTLTFTEFSDILTDIKDPNTALTVAALDLLTAETLGQIPRAVVPDMPERIIAATALTLDLPLVTCDAKINKLSNIRIIW